MSNLSKRSNLVNDNRCPGLSLGLPPDPHIGPGGDLAEELPGVGWAKVGRDQNHLSDPEEQQDLDRRRPPLLTRLRPPLSTRLQPSPAPTGFSLLFALELGGTTRISAQGLTNSFEFVPQDTGLYRWGFVS
ncbi:hypothetical protein WISP_76356 [Willisornis vidua]|uniref:Uncharacterized protein n=1 Tax=Willisornis vidua TaxID=1566151 RepID=A0ABQ9D6E0_9PASS|nr:hypothetical protein WISP_76356 [Willisornis vidua]